MLHLIELLEASEPRLATVGQMLGEVLHAVHFEGNLNFDEGNADKDDE
jgi:hypothetical protein